MRTVYQRRTHPDIERAAQLGRTFGCVRLVWNKTIEWRHRRYHIEGRTTSYKETDAALAASNKAGGLAFLLEVSSVPSQQAPRHQHTAVQSFFAGLDRCVLDAAFGDFRPQLEYPQLEFKAERGGQRLVVTTRWYPSSTPCSSCGHLLNHLKLSVQAWTCPRCRAWHEREVNANMNILAAGRVVARDNPGEACGAGVGPQGPSLRRSATKQEESGVRPAGIPAAHGGA